ncbi:hypothetical protein D3C76_1333530 [compost metagenome]
MARGPALRVREGNLMWMAVIALSMYGQRTDYVGASLLAKAVCQSPLSWVYRRLREQARSHRGGVLSMMAIQFQLSSAG